MTRRTLTPADTASMRDWALDAGFEDDEEIPGLDPAAIARGIERTYDGGIAQFLRDAS